MIRESIEAVVVLLSPVVPHITEELWQMLGRHENLLNVTWPAFRDDVLEYDLQNRGAQSTGCLNVPFVPQGQCLRPDQPGKDRAVDDPNGQHHLKQAVAQE